VTRLYRGCTGLDIVIYGPQTTRNCALLRPYHKIAYGVEIQASNPPF
jgi:hypothetical protein